MSSLPLLDPIRRWPRILVVFVAVDLALYGAYMQIPDRWLIEGVYFPVIVAPGAALIHSIDAADHVQPVGNRLVTENNVLEVVRGCDGAGMLFLLLAAIVACAAGRLASVRRAISGALGALACVWVANQLRIVCLHFILEREADWFVPMHAVVLPTLLVLLGLIYFLWWITSSSDRGSTRPA